MSTYAYSDIYDCAVCNEALAYSVNEEGEALDGCGDLVCLDCALAYTVDMRTGTLTRASEFIERLTAELEEARLTLAAEQGKPEGAPSAGWEFDGRDWNKNYPDGSFAGLSGRRGKRRWMRALWPDTERAPTYFGRGHDVETDRAAMRCADAAHPSTPPASPE